MAAQHGGKLGAARLPFVTDQALPRCLSSSILGWLDLVTYFSAQEAPLLSAFWGGNLSY